MNFLRKFLVFLMFLALGQARLAAQDQPATASQNQATAPDEAASSKLLVVVPFENTSKVPGLEWVGEAFAEVLTSSISSPSIYTIGREDRSYVFDHLGVPINAHLSRATLYRIAEQMDVDYVVLGSYSYNDNLFTAKAQVLDMKKLRLSPETTEAGALPQLVDIQHSLAWDMLRVINPGLTASKQSFVGSSPQIRLDALENYIRGVMATETSERVRHFKEAIRINPDYTMATYQLGKTYYDARDYAPAATWLAKVPKTDKHGLEASFYLGLSAYFIGNYDRAEEAFNFVASRLPLTEVYNNLGVAQARRGRKTATNYFEKAVNADPNDGDYHFNLGLALLKSGNTTEALKHLREAQTLRPGDSEIKVALDAAETGPDSAGKINTFQAGGRMLERIKRNYDEASFRQLSMEIQRVDEMRLAQVDAHTHALRHVDRGREFLKQGFNDDAQKEFREALTLDPAIAAAHLGMASAEAAVNNLSAARSEAAAAVRLQPSADAYILLAQIDLKQNNAQAANDDVRQALALEPANESARSLQQSIAARLTEKTPGVKHP